MSFDSSPKIKLFDLVPDFVEYILRNDASAITLIVCSTRDAFVRELDAGIQYKSQQDEEQEESEDTNVDQSSIHGDTAKRMIASAMLRHPLLSNQIGLISSLQRVTLSFCPSVEHLRAYLSQYGTKNQREERGRSRGTSVLAIVNLVTIHSHTVEFSAQGLSRTFALVIEVAARDGVDLVLCECKSVDDDENAEYGTRLWNIKVPILNSSINIEEGEGRPAGPTVRIRKIAKKWFNFAPPDTEILKRQ